VIYLDTSALVKLVFEEKESSALTDWIAERAEEPKVSSDVSIVELLRTCQRIDKSSVITATLLLEGIDLLPVQRSIIERAASVGPNELRSLDAIHLASALTIKTHLTAFVAYDTRLCAAALEAGMTVQSPNDQY
jgi:predicted nucleic acid-binding protein